MWSRLTRAHLVINYRYINYLKESCVIFLIWRLAKFVPSDDKMKEMESTQWDQWKQMPSSNDVRVVVSFWKLSGHLNSYCQRVQKFKIQCRNVFGRHLLEILSHMYTSIVKSGIVEINVYMYIPNGLTL